MVVLSSATDHCGVMGEDHMQLFQWLSGTNGNISAQFLSMLGSESRLLSPDMVYAVSSEDCCCVYQGGMVV